MGGINSKHTKSALKKSVECKVGGKRQSKEVVVLGPKIHLVNPFVKGSKSCPHQEQLELEGGREESRDKNSRLIHNPDDKHYGDNKCESRCVHGEKDIYISLNYSDDKHDDKGCESAAFLSEGMDGQHSNTSDTSLDNNTVDDNEGKGADSFNYMYVTEKDNVCATRSADFWLGNRKGDFLDGTCENMCGRVRVVSDSNLWCGVQLPCNVFKEGMNRDFCHERATFINEEDEVICADLFCFFK